MSGRSWAWFPEFIQPPTGPHSRLRPQGRRAKRPPIVRIPMVLYAAQVLTSGLWKANLRNNATTNCQARRKNQPSQRIRRGPDNDRDLDRGRGLVKEHN